MKKRLWLQELHNSLYNRFGRLAVDIPSSKTQAVPMVVLEDIRRVLGEEIGQ